MKGTCNCVPEYKNSGLVWPRARLTINLAPANLRKEGPAYDLPIALGVLAASDQLPLDALDGALVVGELSLDGGVRHVRGVLPMAAKACQEGVKTLFVPAEDAAEAALIPDVRVIGVADLAELVNHLYGNAELPALDPASLSVAVGVDISVGTATSVSICELRSSFMPICTGQAHKSPGSKRVWTILSAVAVAISQRASLVSC